MQRREVTQAEVEQALVDVQEAGIEHVDRVRNKLEDILAEYVTLEDRYQQFFHKSYILNKDLETKIALLTQANRNKDLQIHELSKAIEQTEIIKHEQAELRKKLDLYNIEINKREQKITKLHNQNKIQLEQHETQLAEQHKRDVDSHKIEVDKLQKKIDELQKSKDEDKEFNFGNWAELPYRLKSNSPKNRYKEIHSFLTETEFEFSQILFPMAERFKLYVATKVRIEDFIYVNEEVLSKDETSYEANKNRCRHEIKSRHVDFLLLTKDRYIPIMAIELNNDFSHDVETTKDKFCKQLYEKIRETNPFDYRFYKKEHMPHTTESEDENGIPLFKNKSAWGMALNNTKTLIKNDIISVILNKIIPFNVGNNNIIKIPCRDKSCSGHYRMKAGTNSYGCSKYDSKNSQNCYNNKTNMMNLRQLQDYAYTIFSTY
ncbi:MAG: DUF2726 domain-containing protein [Turicibacter sp.]|nr:DUF2726 domain-containing protein [Turicibacter sp.]